MSGDSEFPPETTEPATTETQLFHLATFAELSLRNNITSGKNHFHEMNGDVGMAEWK